MIQDYDSLIALIAQTAPLASNIDRHFAGRPRLRTVAAGILKAELQTLYPQLRLDVARATVLEPLPGAANTRPGYRKSGLIDLLIARLLTDSNIELIQGVHLLTLHAESDNPSAIAIQMPELQRIINDWGPQLLRVYGEHLCRFWDDFDTVGKSRWQWLSSAMKIRLEDNAKRLFATKDLDAEQLATVRLLLDFPDARDRRLPADDLLQVSLLAFLSAADAPASIYVTHGLVIDHYVAAQKRRLVMLFTAFHGLETFASLPALAATLAAREASSSGVSMPLRLGLRSAAGDIFELQAQVILDQQLGHIDWIARLCRDESYGVELLQDAVDDLTGFTQLDTADERRHMETLRTRLPQWLGKAGSRARRACSMHLASLAVSEAEYAGESFLKGIMNIEDFAADALRKRIALDHPEAELGDLADVEVHIVTTPDSLLSIVHSSQPTQDDQQVSLVQFALRNVAGRPAGALFIQAREGATLPEWATRRGIETLIERTDAGGTYVKWLDRQLLSDPLHAARREAIFRAHLPSQLSLLALQYSLQTAHGFTEQAYRYVHAAIGTAGQAAVDGRPVSLKTLGFIAAPGASNDTVLNTYVIAADDDQPSLHILYRPLFETPLLVFNDRTALWQAVCTPGEVQNSTLEWLDDHAHALYANGGFLVPNSVRFGEGSDFAPITAPAPAQLALTALHGNPLEWLYRQNAMAMIAIAKRQSVSSQESRWLGYKALGLALLNAVLPIVSGPVVTAVWLAQLSDSLDEALNKQSHGDQDAAQTWLVDLCLNLALVLLPHSAAKQLRVGRPELLDRLDGVTEADLSFSPDLDEERSGIQEESSSTLDGKLPSVAPGVATAELDLEIGELSAATVQLDFAWSRATHTLSAADRVLLGTFAITEPAQLGTPISHGPLKDLYLHGSRLFLKQGPRFFEVESAQGQLRIIDVDHPARKGPSLRRDEAQRLQLDLRLRGLGGMPRSRIEALRAQNRERIATLKAACASFDRDIAGPMKAWNDMIPVVTQDIPEGNKLALREAFSAKASTVMDLKRKALADLQALRELDSASVTANSYRRVLKTLVQVIDTEIINCYKHMLGAQAKAEVYLRLMQAGDISPAQLEEFNEFLRLNGDFLDRQLSLMDEYRERRRELEQIPGYSQSPLGTAISKPLFDHPREAWVGMLFEGLGLLSVRRLGGSTVADEFMELASKPLGVCAQSQAALEANTQLGLDARVEVLRDLDIQYEAALGRLAYYSETLGERLEANAVGRLSELAQQLRAKVQAALIPLARQQLKLARAERKAKLKASDGLVSTRRYGWVVGKLRPRTGAHERFEVQESISQRVVSSFEKDLAAGDWVEVVPAPVPESGPPGQLSSNLAAHIRRGKALLPQAAGWIASARKQAGKDYLPQDIETLLLQHSSQLNGAADAIEHILTANNQIDLPSEGQSTEVQVKQMRETAQRLSDEGQAIRIQMTKRQPPSASRVAYLQRLNAVRIRKLGQRVALKKGAGFLQEYEVADLDGSPLWYAHFHYKAAEGDIRAYTRAHLKTREQRRLGAATQMRQEALGEEVIAILRSRIDAPLDEIYLVAV